jgi:hypothetical protein
LLRVEQYRIDKTVTGSEDYYKTSIGTIVNKEEVRKYDYAMSDGSFVSSTAELTQAQKDACVGIVFWTKAEDTEGLDLDADGYTHGLIAGLDIIGDQEYNWLTTTGESISMYDYQMSDETLKAYPSIRSTDKLVGYTNTKILEQYSTDNSDAPMNIWEALSDAELITAKNASSWYIPSIKELVLLNENYSPLKTIDIFLNAWNYNYWSSTEYDTNEAYFHVIYGQDFSEKEDGWAKYSDRSDEQGVRPVCAF